ncbi:MAG TPA: Crp/Fnr family transcriptional regulator [Candidatus Angelobacter sp.]|jgi:CRP-like cAMP-binding protein|nr:Crp/Fnr family transcriptional regulator [Candidatus Angelobacter sp.]
MRRNPGNQQPFQNSILSGLTGAEYARFAPHLEPVSLPAGKVLVQAGGAIKHAYFLNSGMASVVATLRNGAALEVGVIGREGVADVNALLGCTINLNLVIVQVAMTAMRIKASMLMRLYEDSAKEFRATGNRYIQYRLNQVSQSAICNHAHEIEERLARWLLTTADAVGESQFELTHEFLSQMLGARRSSVTLAAGTLAHAGVIEYRRGRILILKRAALEDLACECYLTLKSELATVNEN